MKRAFFVLTTIALILGAAVLAATTLEKRRDFQVDEVRMVAFDANRPALLIVPAGTESVILHVIASVDASAAEEAVAIDLEGSWIERASRAALGEPFDIRVVSRVSRGEGPECPPRGCFGARIEGSDLLATDNRELWIPTPPATAQSDVTLSLRAGRGATSVFVRGFAVRVRDLVSQTAGRVMDARAREHVGHLASGLGFVDLPERSRERALAVTRDRLDVEGRLGAETELTRVALSSFRARPPHPPPTKVAQRPVSLTPGHPIALNVDGAPRVALDGPPGARVALGELGEEPAAREMTLDAAGRATFTAEGEGPRTLTLASAQPVDLHVGSPAADEARWLGDPTRLSRTESGLEVGPDERVIRYYALHEEQSLAYTVEARQVGTRIELRTIADAPAATVRARFVARHGSITERMITVPSSHDPVDRFAEGDSTSRPTSDEPPFAGAGTLYLSGPETVVARVIVDEPGVVEEILEAPYRIALPENARWLRAPRERSNDAVLRPDDLVALRAAGRERSVVAQVRIERVTPQVVHPTRRRPRPWFGRELAFGGSPATQRVMLPARGPRGANDWSALPVSEERTLRVGDSPCCAFLVESAALGSRGTLVIDDERHEIAMRTRAVRSDVRVPAGPHRIRLDGIPAGRLLVRGPLEGASSVVLRDFTELRESTEGELSFELRPGDAARVLLQIVTRHPGDAFRIRHTFSMDGVHWAATPANDSLAVVGAGRERPPTLLWDLGHEVAGGYFEATIRLPEVPYPRGVKLRLRVVSSDGDSVFVRPVLLARQRFAGRERAFIRRSAGR